MSSFTVRNRRRGGYEDKPKPTPKKNKGKDVVEVSIGKKIPVIANFDLDTPNGDAYTEGIGFVSRSISGNREFKEGLLDDVLVYERFEYAGRSVYGLINRKEVKLLAFVAVEDAEDGEAEAVVVVLEDKLGFESVETFLKEEEGLEESQFLYYTNPAEYSLEHVSFSLYSVRNDLKVISDMSLSNVKMFEHVYTFARLFCLFLVPAIMPEWREMFSKELMHSVDADHTILLPDEYVAIWRNWGKVSEFVHSDGKTVLPLEVGIMDLGNAKKHLSILKSRDMIGPFVPTKFVRAKGKHYHSFASAALNMSLVGDAGSSSLVAAASADTRSVHMRTRSAPDFLVGRRSVLDSRGPGLLDPNVGASRGAAGSARGRKSLLQIAIRPLVKFAKFFKTLPK